MQVRVYNDNVYDFQQNFKGDLIKIPAKKFVEMEDDDAVMFKGLYSPIEVDGANNHLPQSFKMIRVVYPDGFKKEEEKGKSKCQACAKEFDSPMELDAHVTANHIEQMIDKDEKEKRQGKKH